MIQHIAISILAAINKVIPKRRSALILGWPDYAPNAVAISNALVQHTDLRIIMLMPDGAIPPPATMQLSDRLTTRKHRSLAGVWSYLTSRYVFLTHGILGNRFWSRRQVVVQMWHGMPLKRIVALDGQQPPQGLDYVVAAGPFWTDILSEAFNVNASRVLSTGTPRTDLLLTTDVRSSEALNSLPGVSEGDRVVAWLPTYRRSIIGDIRIDGAEIGNELQISEEHFVSLDEAFAQAGVKCIVKAHPMAPRYSTGSHENLLFMTDDDLSKASIDLYTLLGVCEGLITDISGVWVDFLSTAKPILFFFPDIDTYTAGRGLTCDHYGDLIPGPLVTDPEELPDAIRLTFSPPSRLRASSAEIRNLNVAEDANSSLRLLQALGIAGKDRTGDR